MPLFIHMVSAIICLGCSTFFHLYKDHSEKYSRLLSRLDYGGISILIAGSNTPPIIYSFYCEPTYGKLTRLICTIKINYIFCGYSLEKYLHRIHLYLLLGLLYHTAGAKVWSAKIHSIKRSSLRSVWPTLYYSLHPHASLLKYTLPALV